MVDVVSAYSYMYEELKQIEKKKYQERLAKEIEELESKRKKLESLNAQ
jgi:hypothetical protein